VTFIGFNMVTDKMSVTNKRHPARGLDPYLRQVRDLVGTKKTSGVSAFRQTGSAKAEHSRDKLVRAHDK
jgi:hypothetical protein